MNQRAKNVIFFIFYFIGLLFIYINDVSIYWGYMGFPRDFSLGRAIAAVTLILVLSFSAPTKINVRNFFLLLIVYLYIAPAAIIFFMGGGSYLYILIAFSGFLILLTAERLAIKRIYFCTVTRKSALYICFGMTIFSIIAIIIFGGVSTFNLNILRVYEFRSEAAENLPRIFGYIVSPVSKIILPIGIVLGIYYKSMTTSIIFFILSVLFFGLTHHKSILVAPIIVAIIYYYLRYSKNFDFLHKAFISVIAIALIEFIVIQNFSSASGPGLFSSLFIRRTLFVPPLLDTFYIDYFSSRDFVFWANSRISFGLSATKYDLGIPFLIGDEFFSNSETAANTGFIGSGYANAGFVGVAIYAVIIGKVISLLNSYGNFLGHPLVASASLTIVISTITTTDVITSLLTHGLIMLLVFLSMMPNPGVSNGIST